MKNPFNIKIMKKLMHLILLCLFTACNLSSNKNIKSTASKANEAKVLKSGDYTTFLNNYTCDIELAEMAEVLDVPLTDLSFSDDTISGKCTFNLKGFGKNSISGESRLLWGPAPSSKRQNKKEIAGYLERKKEGQKIMGMDIVLAETGDCYLAYQPAYGMLTIYNENHDHTFIINYGRRSVNTDRTKEQHEALKNKMTDLANYLLQKHRK